MSGLRDLVTGADGCSAGDGAGPSNAAAGLADALLGRRGKQAQQLQELPGMHGPGPSTSMQAFRPRTAAQAAEAALAGELPSIAGLPPHMAAQADVDAFLRGLPGGQLGGPSEFAEFESIFARQQQQQQHGGLAPPPMGALAEQGRAAAAPMLQAFLDSSKARAPFRPMAPPPPPGAALSLADQCRVRDRSTIMARQLFAERGAAFADEQVGALLAALNISAQALPAEGPGGAAGASWDRIFGAAAPRVGQPSAAGEHAMAAAMQQQRMQQWRQETQQAQAQQMQQAQAQQAQQPWAQEFERLSLGEGGGWAAEYQQQQQQQQGPAAQWAQEHAAEEASRSAGWVNEFRSTAAAGSAMRQQAAGDALEQTRKLADTLAASGDPKMRGSKFLQFVSKMSRGELILEDNQVKEVPPAAAAWVNEFGGEQQRRRQQGAPGGPAVWGDEFAAFQAGQHPGAAATTGQQWAQDFGEGAADWADQFAEGLTGGGAWANEFGAAAAGSTDVAAWEEEYARELQRLHESAGPSAAGAYVFAADNPFMLDADSLAKGKDLFRRGVLSEAVLALEAECQRQPGNAEAWRLLGTVQAENDDDQQAIAAMNRALAADPSNLDVLLSLGVSHTNELEQGEALGYLRRWVLTHPKHAAAAGAVPPVEDSSQAARHVAELFEAAARAHPQDGDVYSALGVVYNLGRQYDEAVEAFRQALALCPRDYSLWNKLGATLANSSRSGDAIAAYQQALELKPNYMRAWTNMGISLANLADYNASSAYYVRALALNPNASTVWGYLRTSLACAGRQDLRAAAEAQDLLALQKALPLEEG